MKPIKYTPEMRAWLERNIPLRSHAATAELFTAKFGILTTRERVRCYASNYAIRRIDYRLTAEQIEWLREHGEGRNDRELTELFNEQFGQARTVSQITSLRYRYGAPSGLVPRPWNSGRFKKGHISHNKGRPWSEWMPTKSAEQASASWFKPGNEPARKPVGSTRIDKDGYYIIKTAEPRTWRNLHRVIWEEAHGPLETGDVITFLDGNPMNCTLENLAKISRAVLARMNHGKLRSSNPKLTELGILIAKISTKIGKKIRRVNNEQKMD